MKRYVFIGILCLFSLYVIAGYYYYHGERVTININTDSVVIYTPNMIRSGHAIPSIQSTIIARSQVNQIALDDSTQISAIGYIIGDTITRKMSNCFYVKLYEDEDTTLLQEVVRETETVLLGQVPHMDKWYKIMIDHSVINNSLEMSNYFYETGLFADVDPGFVFEFQTSCVNDWYFPQQWEHVAINSCNAWSKTKGTSSIRVAIVDAGIYKDHDEFINTTFMHPSYDCLTNQEIDTIYKSHGTYVSGIIAANHNYGLLAGIAPNVCLMQVSHPMETTPNISAEFASGISWAVKNNADVINCSWGDHGGESFAALHSTILEESIKNALYNGRNGKGCIVVFASGNCANDNLPIDYPGYFTPENLIVGAIGHLPTFGRADFSAHGSSLDVMAPGQNIHLLDRFNKYAFTYGTSLAAPYVSGIAALVLSVNPDLTREEVTNIIEFTAQRVGDYDYAIKNEYPNGKWHEEMGYGLVDAYAAVLAAQPKYIQNQIYQTGEEVYEYAPEITAGYAVTDSEQYGNVICEAGSEVLLRAMDRIRLKPGFHAQSGSKVHIVTDSWTYTPSDSVISAPQRIAPRSSSASADDTEQTDKVSTSNSLENIESDMIQSTAIYTISGQLLQTIEGGKRDAAHLPNGMYILQHRMSDGSMKSEKIANNK